MQALHSLADHIREEFSYRGYRIGSALELDPAFRRDRRPQSSLTRSLLLDAIDRHAGGLGLNVIPTPGGGKEIELVHEMVARRFRVQKSEWDEELGSFRTICNSDSVLTLPDVEIHSFYKYEHWTFGFTAENVGNLDKIFAAPILGLTEGIVKYLILGQITLLGTGSAPDPNSEFMPGDDDGLDFGDAADGLDEAM